MERHGFVVQSRLIRTVDHELKWNIRTLEQIRQTHGLEMTHDGLKREYA